MRCWGDRGRLKTDRSSVGRILVSDRQTQILPQQIFPCGKTSDSRIRPTQPENTQTHRRFIFSDGLHAV
ncbi:hypothetical protein HMPREF9120_02149 [Neisseria sp. oral taxon 020 str. F0370]|nr:hypothetical protein HMPREF9120_02149 [Neisseria sp. oral taxon 020 str. F0370]